MSRRLAARIALAAVVLAVFVCLGAWIRLVATDVSPFYPRNHDQAGYLAAAYADLDYAQANGWPALWRVHLAHDSAAGFRPTINLQMAFDAAHLFAIFGASRGVALAFHGIAWLVFVAVFLGVVRRLDDRPWILVLALGLVLLTKTAFRTEGSLLDFRMEFPATCWFGTAGALWILAIERPARGVAWAAAAATLVLASFRVIAAVYWAPPLATLFAIGIVQRLRGSRGGLAPLVLPIAAVGAGVLALVLWDLDFLLGYYVTAQNTEGAVRDAGDAWLVRWGRWLYFPQAFQRRDLGAAFRWVALGALAVGLVRAAAWRRFAPVAGGPRLATIVFAAVVALLPLAVLTYHAHPALQVSGIGTFVFVLGTVLLVSRLTAGLDGAPWLVVALGVLVLGTAVWARNLQAASPFPTPAARRDGEAVNAVLEAAVARLERSPRPWPRFCALEMADAFVSAAAEVHAAERRGRSLRIAPGIPRSIFPQSRDELAAELPTCDLLVVPRPPLGPVWTSYPIARSLDAALPELLELAAGTHETLVEFTFRGRRFALLGKREPVSP